MLSFPCSLQSYGYTLSPAAPRGFRSGLDFSPITQRFLITTSICIVPIPPERCLILQLNVLVRELASLGVGLRSFQCCSPQLWRSRGRLAGQGRAGTGQSTGLMLGMLQEHTWVRTDTAGYHLVLHTDSHQPWSLLYPHQKASVSKKIQITESSRLENSLKFIQSKS